MMAPIKAVLASPYFWFGLGLFHSAGMFLRGDYVIAALLFGVNLGFLVLFAMVDYYLLRRPTQSTLTDGEGS